MDVTILQVPTAVRKISPISASYGISVRRTVYVLAFLVIFGPEDVASHPTNMMKLPS